MTAAHRLQKNFWRNQSCTHIQKQRIHFCIPWHQVSNSSFGIHHSHKSKKFHWDYYTPELLQLKKKQHRKIFDIKKMWYSKHTTILRCDTSSSCIPNKSWCTNATRSDTHSSASCSIQPSASRLAPIVGTSWEHFISWTSGCSWKNKRSIQINTFEKCLVFSNSKKNILRQLEGGTHCPIIFLTSPGAQIQPDNEQTGVQPVASNLLQLRWQPSFPHAENISVPLVHVIGAKDKKKYI